MASITLSISSKITNLIPKSEIKFYTRGAQTFFADIEAGTGLQLNSQRTLDFIIVSGASATDNNLNGTWNVPGAGNTVVNADGELSIGKKVVDGVVVIDWHIKP